MERENRYPRDQYPPTNYLAAAIKDLPTPDLNIPPQTVEIDAGSLGRYRVTFVVRQNAELPMPTWFWGIESGQRIGSAQGPAAGVNDPGSEGTGG
jgi:hypothetical protein